MKIDITNILRDHLGTLRNANTGRTSILDLTIFFMLPLLLGALAYIFDFHVGKDVYSVSITFFGIFTPLLLNIQVAVFSIFQRKWEAPKDKRLAEIQAELLALRNIILSEINANISYLVLFCCVALILFLGFFTADLERGLAPATAVALYAHFLLTLIMVVKRSHALFQKEYRDAPGQ